MAVPGFQSAMCGPLYGTDVPRTAPARAGRVFRALTTLGQIYTDPLPSNMREQECSVVVLFRSSQALNYLTGGGRAMTFSARCHVARRTTRNRVRRTGWTLMAMGIDAICGVLRGECEHCATAWANHLARTEPSGEA